MNRPARAQPGTPRGFTLVELLVSIAIIAVLISLLLPALGSAMGSSRSFKCQMGLRSVAFDFSVFADDTLHGDRGDDERDGGSSFTLETFQESEYGVDEFWRWGEGESISMPDAAGNDPLRCPEVSGDVVLRPNSPCSGGAVSPAANVSYAFNLRLHRAEKSAPSGATRLVPVRLKEQITQQASVPLLIDVDGEAAQAGAANALYTAPSAGSSGPLGNDRFWFPSSRHGGRTNAAFIGGHVLSSGSPASEPGWRWDYQPIR